jgi:hypothetical protein
MARCELLMRGWAWRIIGIGNDLPNGGAHLSLTPGTRGLENGIDVDADFMQKFKPEIGDSFVKFDTGYEMIVKDSGSFDLRILD